MKISELIGKKIAVHCPTEELYRKCMDMLDLQPMKYRSMMGGLYVYESDVCFEFFYSASAWNYEAGMQYSPIGFYERGDYEIITAEQFIQSNS